MLADNLLEKMNALISAHRNGRREDGQTVQNLKYLAEVQDEDGRQLLFSALTRYAIDELQRPATIHKFGRVLRPNPFFVALLFSDYLGHSAQLVTHLFAHLDRNNPIVVTRWVEDVHPELLRLIYVDPDSSRTELLKQVHALLSFHIGHLNTAQATPQGDRLDYCMNELQQAVEEVEFQRFELDLRVDALARQHQVASGVRGAERPEHEEIPEVVRRAFSKARETLQQSGEFNPKTAADLIRSILDETHREVLSELLRLRRDTQPVPSKDGERRQLLRRLEFVSPAEEKFLSAVYGLLSEEGTHRLIAPRETVLIFLQTTESLAALLFRRLANLKVTSKPQ